MTIISEIPAGASPMCAGCVEIAPGGSGPLESRSDPPLPAPRPASRLPYWDGALSTPKSVAASRGLLVPPAAWPCRPREPGGPPPGVSSDGWSSSPCLCRDRVSRLERCSPRSNTSRCLPGTSPTGCVPRRPRDPDGHLPGVSSGGGATLRVYGVPACSPNPCGTVPRLGCCSFCSKISHCLPGTSPNGCVPRRPWNRLVPLPGLVQGGGAGLCACAVPDWYAGSRLWKQSLLPRISSFSVSKSVFVVQGS